MIQDSELSIYARRDMIVGPVTGKSLLLEGSWDAVSSDRHAHRSASHRWSLDEEIDARFSHVDLAAVRLSETLAGSASQEVRPGAALSFASINALALRYYLVKLLRLVTFFRDIAPLRPGDRITAWLSCGRDEDYAALLTSVAETHGAELVVNWGKSAKPSPATPKAKWNRTREWIAAALASRNVSSRISGKEHRNSHDRPIMLCGDTRHLDPLCEELLRRGRQLVYLNEQLSLRNVWKWRKTPVTILHCPASADETGSSSDSRIHQRLSWENVDLTDAVMQFLGTLSREQGARQNRWIDQIDKHLRQHAPHAILLDEDATPFKRIVVLLAQRQGIPTLVVQHGAPVVRFAFVPTLADRFCASCQGSANQMINWGAEPDRVFVTGTPKNEQVQARIRGIKRKHSPTQSPRFLLLATTIPRDHRPDAVQFHLTTATYQGMLHLAWSSVSQIEGGSLVVKLHPRSRETGFYQVIARDYPGLHTEFVRTGDLADLLPGCTAVLSCVSTAGIEALACGIPVIQLRPQGSANVLSDPSWNFQGTARGSGELLTHLRQAVAGGWNSPPLPQIPDGAASRIVDLALSNAIGQNTPITHRQLQGAVA